MIMYAHAAVYTVWDSVQWDAIFLGLTHLSIKESHVFVSFWVLCNFGRATVKSYNPACSDLTCFRCKCKHIRGVASTSKADQPAAHLMYSLRFLDSCGLVLVSKLLRKLYRISDLGDPHAPFRTLLLSKMTWSMSAFLFIECFHQISITGHMVVCQDVRISTWYKTLCAGTLHTDQWLMHGLSMLGLLWICKEIVILDLFVPWMEPRTWSCDI
mmetsp:Transcript_37665/g.72164  ORF Transcript_37665/g.72164 Transcript_37665/m.72164 type:complete len:213 (-) Transcript_37665:1057-1695(-)